MGKELVAKTQHEMDLEAIRNLGKIVDKERFDKGVQFATLVIEGLSRKKAYEIVFEVDNKIAESRAGNFFRTKWMQELIRYLRPDDDTLYIGEIQTIIKKGMSIVRDGRTSNRDFTEAIKALQPYIKQAVIKQEATLLVTHEVSEGQTMMEKMDSKINELSGSNKMINEKQEIVDVELIQ